MAFSADALAGSFSSRRPTTTSRRSTLPFRHTSTGTVAPTSASDTMRGRARIFSTCLPSKDSTMSPAWSPPLSAGLSGSTAATSAPRGSPNPSNAAAISSVTFWIRTPSQPAPGLAEAAELVDHRRGERGRHGETDTHAAARGRGNGGVHADHPALKVQHRAAGIALVDRGVGLDEIVIGAGADIPLAGRDDARGHRAGEAERVADGDDPVAHPRLVRIPEFEEGQRLVGFDPVAPPGRSSGRAPRPPPSVPCRPGDGPGSRPPCRSHGGW